MVLFVVIRMYLVQWFHFKKTFIQKIIISKEILLRIINSFLGTVYLIIIIKALESRGLDVVKYFCAYNWLILMIVHYLLAIMGNNLY